MLLSPGAIAFAARLVLATIVVERTLEPLRECLGRQDLEDPEQLNFTGGGPRQLILTEEAEKVSTRIIPRPLLSNFWVF